MLSVTSPLPPCVFSEAVFFVRADVSLCFRDKKRLAASSHRKTRPASQIIRMTITSTSLLCGSLSCYNLCVPLSAMSSSALALGGCYLLKAIFCVTQTYIASQCVSMTHSGELSLNSITQRMKNRQIQVFLRTDARYFQSRPLGITRVRVGPLYTPLSPLARTWYSYRVTPSTTKKMCAAAVARGAA